MGAAPPEPLSNCKNKAVYPLYLICAKKLSFDKVPDREFVAARITTKRTYGMGHSLVKMKSLHRKKVYLMSYTAERLMAALQNISVEQKYIDRRKQLENSSVRRKNESVPDMKDDKDKRASIIAKEIFNRRVSDMEHQLQHFKSKVYYNTSNYQHSINTHQEKVDIFEEVIEAEREDGRQNMHCMKEELDDTSKKSDEILVETRCDSICQISEMEEKVYAKSEKAEETRHASHQKSADILDEEKEKVTKVRRLASCKIADNIAEIEENIAEVRRVTFRNMDDTEDDA